MLEKAGKGQLLPGVRVYKSQPDSILGSGAGLNAVFRESRKNITLQVLPQWPQWHQPMTCSLLCIWYMQVLGWVSRPVCVS